MSAFRILLSKELLESWRTFRLPVAAVLFALVGLSSPVLARYLPEILELAGGDQFGVIEIPTPTVADAVDQLLKNLVQFGALAAILLAMGLVASEKDRGTAAFLLAKPVSRGTFLAAKLTALGLVLALCTLLATVLGWAYTAILFEPVDPVGWAWMALLVWLTMLAYAAITFLASTLTGSAAAAAGIGFGLLLGLSILAALPSIERFLPPGLLKPASALAAGAATPGSLGADLIVPVVSAVVLVAACVGVAAWSFRHQEL